MTADPRRRRYEQEALNQHARHNLWRLNSRCGTCGRGFTTTEWEDRHRDRNRDNPGGYVHAACCNCDEGNVE